MSIVRLSSVLLVGGESLRMGRDKATIDFAGKSLWQNQLATLRKLKPLDIFISARSEPRWRPADTIFVADATPSVGPLSGLVASLGQTRGTHLVALAIDLPSMTADFLQALADQCSPGCGIVPAIGDRVEPLAAIYPIEAISEFAGALRGTDHSLQTIVHQLEKTGKIRLIPVENRNLFRNLNSPADLETHEQTE